MTTNSNLRVESFEFRDKNFEILIERLFRIKYDTRSYEH